MQQFFHLILEFDISADTQNVNNGGKAFRVNV